MRIKNKNDIKKKALELRHKIINLELLGALKTHKQEQELTGLTGAYDACMWMLGCSRNCRAVL